MRDMADGGHKNAWRVYFGSFGSIEALISEKSYEKTMRPPVLISMNG